MGVYYNEKVHDRRAEARCANVLQSYQINASFCRSREHSHVVACCCRACRRNTKTQGRQKFAYGSRQDSISFLIFPLYFNFVVYLLYLDVLPCTPNAFRYLNRQVDHPTKCFVVQYTAASQSNYILNLQLSFRETTPRNRASCFPPWFKRRDNDLQVPTSHTCRM